MGTNMWNLHNIEQEIKNTPNAILIEQANYFEKETKNVLYAKLYNMRLSVDEEFKYKLATSFVIVSPALDDYSYTLFTVYSNPESSYPVAISINENKEDDYYFFVPDYECQNDKEFTEALAEVIGSEKTTEIVQTLYSKSKAY